MKYVSSVFTTLMLVSSCIATADVMIYPAKGQDSATQQKDEGECFVWARNETGIDAITKRKRAIPRHPFVT